MYDYGLSTQHINMSRQRVSLVKSRNGLSGNYYTVGSSHYCIRPVQNADPSTFAGSQQQLEQQCHQPVTAPAGKGDGGGSFPSVESVKT